MESPPPPQSDLQLQDRRQLFSRLMREHHRDLLVFAGAATRDSDAARDIVQEALVSAWKKFDEFEKKRDFGAWVRGIVRFKTKDWFRRQNRQPVSDSDLVELEIDLNAWRDSLPADTTIFEKVEECIGKLPCNFKAAVRSFYFEDRTGEEAASNLNISPSNLRKRLERARALLHDCLSAPSISVAVPTESTTNEAHV